MRKILLLLILFLLLLNNKLASQSNDWQLPHNMGGMAIKKEGNVIYSIDSVLYATGVGDAIVSNTKAYIIRNLDILHESGFNKPIAIIFLHDRHHMHKSFEKREQVLL